MQRYRLSLLAVCSIGTVMVCCVSRATMTPYTPDGSTTHLWHFDDTAGGTTAADSGTNGGYNLTLSAGASIVASSLSGFGNALSTTGANGDIATFSPAATNPANGQLVGTNGSFTIDMLLKVNDTTQDNVIIYSYEGSTNANRVLHAWFFQDAGTPAVLLESLATGGAAPVWDLPVTGPNAIDTTDWFHLGFSYDKTTGMATAYWTKADPSNTIASQLGSPAAFGNLKSSTGTTIGVGNIARNADSTPSLNGFMDEVRVSTVPRGASDFIFHPAPEPPTFVLAGIGILALCVGRMRGRI